MKTELITQESKSKIKDEVTKLFNGEVESVEFIGIYPSLIITTLEDLGADVSEDIDVNGYLGDYWITLEYNNEKYSIDGCMYYGTVTVKKEEK